MIIPHGSTDVTRYFVLRDSTNHAVKTDVDVTTLDLYYIEEGELVSAKIDATALSAADDPHADGKAIHCGRGVYRIDWPDAAFDGGAGKHVTLVVEGSGIDAVFLDIELGVPVSNVSEIASAIWEHDLGSGSTAALLIDGYLDAAVSSRSSHTVADIWNALTSGLSTAGSIGKLLVDNINATISSRSSHSAADVWAAGTRTLTSFGTLAADTTSAVWAAGTRTLTSFGTLAADAATAVWDKATATLTTVGSIGKYLVDKLTNAYSESSVRNAVGLSAADLEVQLQSIAGSAANAATLAEAAATNAEAASTSADAAAVSLADGGFTNALIDAIKTKTDLIPASPASAGDVDAVPAAVLAQTVDSIELSKLLTLLFAVVAGEATPSGSTVTFKKVDGSTNAVRITYGATDGERTLIEVLI